MLLVHSVPYTVDIIGTGTSPVMPGVDIEALNEVRKFIVLSKLMLIDKPHPYTQTP